MSTESVLNDPNVQELAKVMDLIIPKEFIVVTEYHFDGASIVIEDINVVDKFGKFKRKANLDKVLPYLKSMHVTFL
jgi:hypothetical protein